MQKSELIGLRVEVSGWDAEGQFFVEHSALGSPESGQKTYCCVMRSTSVRSSLSAPCMRIASQNLMPRRTTSRGWRLRSKMDTTSYI